MSDIIPSAETRQNTQEIRRITPLKEHTSTQELRIHGNPEATSDITSCIETPVNHDKNTQKHRNSTQQHTGLPHPLASQTVISPKEQETKNYTENTSAPKTTPEISECKSERTQVQQLSDIIKPELEAKLEDSEDKPEQVIRFVLTLPLEMHQELRAISEAKGCSMARLIRSAIEILVDMYQEKEKSQADPVHKTATEKSKASCT